MNNKDSFGDRMKLYEQHETARCFIPLLPIYARIDGRCFSNFTQTLDRPFDRAFSQVMIHTTRFLVEKTHALIGYTQSDEISLVWCQERTESDLLFGGKVFKITSVLASMAAAYFNNYCAYKSLRLAELARIYAPHFDCRVFQLPNKTEAANVMLWRERDATKNAISMAARCFYSHKELLNKNGSEMQEMMFQKGQNFNDYPAFFKRGTFVRRITTMREFLAEEIAKIPEEYRPVSGTKVQRHETVELAMPSFGAVTNREAVIFDGADPIVVQEA
jgi:tRNA(His) guanylyltransferase